MIINIIIVIEEQAAVKHKEEYAISLIFLHIIDSKRKPCYIKCYVKHTPESQDLLPSILI